MTGFATDGEGLPFPDQLVGFAWYDGEHGEIERGDALHGEYVKGADGDTVLLSVAAVAVDDGEHGASFRLALARAEIHKSYDAGRYTQRE